MTLLVASVALVGTLVGHQTPQAVAQMGRVSGQVVERGTNTPVAGAHVFLVVDGAFSTRDDPLPTAETDRDGRYHFDSLPAGRYHIAAQKDGFAPPMDPSAMEMFELSAGQVLEGLTVSMQRGGVIAGRVLDPLGQPLAKVGVTALLKRLASSDRLAGPTAPGTPLLMPSGQSQTNDLGEFRIVGLSAGEYVIAANPRPDFSGNTISSSDTTVSSGTTIMTSTFFPGTPDVSTAQPVTVQAAETVSDLAIRLVAVPAFQVSGVVVDQAGAPQAEVMVMLVGGRGTDSLLSLLMEPLGMSQSDAAGRFTFGDVPSGSYTLRTGDGGVGFFAATENFIIDSSGTPRTGPSRRRPAPMPGALEVTVENGNVSNLKLVVSRSQ